ncbi:MAG: hypothetical protein HY360_05220 [Verrucomicrobia bacterium]|nr:hypothetical protein [Verrucomicrobiota bacterium]
MAAVMSAGSLGLLFAVGGWLNRADAVHREFLHGGTWIQLSAPNSTSGGRILFLADSQVMGEHYGKLLRAWCRRCGVEIWTPVHGETHGGEIPRVIAENDIDMILLAKPFDALCHETWIYVLAGLC